ncbi:DNA polymerase epsilon subunit [Rhynchospora pubera]|uniref:DNA polymerase epsilon subunit n=1 Tax=Rhynchospora pubera TaxID=906938 RepID=A0AAV8H466_9POAL|nr:DNA polymerase epsilon subunit [Rhynchospora pubera]
MGEAAMRKKAQKKFRIRGFTLKVDALDAVLSFISRFPEAEEEALEILIDGIEKESLKSTILDKEAVQTVIDLLLEAESAIDPTSTSVSSRTALRVIDAFVIPRFRYDPIKNVFYEHTGKLPIHGEAADKAALYRDRYQLMLQRLTRDKYFSTPAFVTELMEDESCKITTIQSLTGCKGRRWITGVISQLEEGRFYLEDLTAAIAIDLSDAISFLYLHTRFYLISSLKLCNPDKFNPPILKHISGKCCNEDIIYLNTKHKITSGFFVENTVIVAEGELQLDCTFKVSTCGFPPLENREVSVKQLMGLDFFGGGILSAEETLRLSELEEMAVNDMFVILSDVWLDDEETMKKLAVVLDGYESVEAVPSLFVLMGNFCSKPCNLAFHSFSDLRMQFKKLGEMIQSRKRIMEQSRFLFIPGPDDIGPAKVLPRCALPKYLTEELQKLVPNAIFSTNPCRIKFYTQEIVFFRQDLLYRMRRACLVPPSTEETTDPFEHLVATITHQSHLCPLPLTVEPIIWNYDHCLRLYPTPHTIVLGDKSEQKAFKYSGITCFNPGSFSKDATFAAYRPCTKDVELSGLES